MERDGGFARGGVGRAIGGDAPFRERLRSARLQDFVGASRREVLPACRFEVQQGRVQLPKFLHGRPEQPGQRAGRRPVDDVVIPVARSGSRRGGKHAATLDKCPEPGGKGFVHEHERRDENQIQPVEGIRCLDDPRGQMV